MHLEFDADEQELELFLAETNDHLQLLDQHLVQLETTPEDERLLQSIFRSAHTIKGGAGLIGHQRMAELAHSMENVLDGLRARTLSATPATIDALLTALDALRVLNDEIITRIQSDIAIEAIRDALSACLTPGVAPRQQEQTSPASRPVMDEDTPGDILAHWERDDELDRLLAAAPPSQLYAVRVAVDPDCGLSAARTLQAYMEMERATRILRALPTPQQIEADETTNELRALIVSEELPSLLEHRLSTVADVIEVSVEPIALPTPDAPRSIATSDGSQSTAAPDAPQSAIAAAGSTTPAPDAARPAPAGATARPAGEKPAQETSIRISVSIVDDLMSLVSELVLGRTRLQTLRAQLQEHYKDDERVANLEDAVSHLDRVSNDLQATVMKARMLPVENVFNKFPRLMRDLAGQSGKKVTFTMSGQDTELDRSVIEQLSDPLIHLLRNAIDHGMETPEERLAAGKSETGSITLSATPCENHILIEVSDDGRGIDGAKVKASAVAKGLLSAEATERMSDREAVDLVFMPGLSTARAITDISGRGVGMDIVKATLERMGGHISIDSTLGTGTTFAVTLPLTLAIMQALLVSVDGTVYALPLNTVTEILSIAADEIQVLQGTEVTLLRDTILPIVRLREYFGYTAAPPSSTLHIVATRVDGQPLGLMVDHFIGEQEIVMKPLGTYMGVVPGLAGATILGDGRIGLLVDIAALRDWSPASRQLTAAS